MRVNQEQELVIAGYIPSPQNIDVLNHRLLPEDKQIYATRTRTGFTPASRL
jgi:hypothetical protein